VALRSHPDQYAEECRKGINNYLGCSLVYPDPACVGPTEEYTDATTITWYTDENTLPPSLFANGGLAGEPEIVALQSVIDFQFSLSISHLWEEDEDFMDCLVNPPVHGRGLREFLCRDDGPLDTVWWRTALWLDGQI
jgi:hypothetical protein